MNKDQCCADTEHKHADRLTDSDGHYDSQTLRVQPWRPWSSWPTDQHLVPESVHEPQKTTKEPIPGLYSGLNLGHATVSNATEQEGVASSLVLGKHL